MIALKICVLFVAFAVPYAGWLLYLHDTMYRGRPLGDGLDEPYSPGEVFMYAMSVAWPGLFGACFVAWLGLLWTAVPIAVSPVVLFGAVLAATMLISLGVALIASILSLVLKLARRLGFLESKSAKEYRRKMIGVARDLVQIHQNGNADADAKEFELRRLTRFARHVRRLSGKPEKPDDDFSDFPSIMKLLDGI